jgi:hypothetical protein
LAWVIKKVKMQQWKEREKDSQITVRQKKECIFLAMRYCVKCTGKSNAGRKSEEGLIVQV